MRSWIVLVFLLTHNYYVFAVTLQGTVTKSDGGAIATGALVLVRGTDILGTVSDTDGTYAVEVPPGVYGLTCAAPGLKGIHTGAVNLTDNTTRNFSLDKPATNTYPITGIATCGQTTCKGVLVLVYQGERVLSVGLSTDDLDGYAAEGLAEGTYSLTAVAFGYLPQRQPDFVVAASGTPTFNPVLTAGAPEKYTVNGSVGLVDNPLDRSGSRVNRNGTDQPKNTLPDGSYSLSGVPAGLLSFSASHQGYNQANHIDVFIEGNTTLDFALSQDNGYRIDGRITLDAAADGTTPSLLHSLVTLWTTDRSQHFSTVTDADGYYVIANLPAGNYQIGAAREGYTTQVSDPFDLAANRTWSVQLAVNPRWDYGPGDRADLPGCSVSSSNNPLWALIIGLLILLFSPPRT